MIAESSTIAGLLTPLAPGAIAVIGLSGPATREILGRILRRHKDDGAAALKLSSTKLRASLVKDGVPVVYTHNTKKVTLVPQTGAQ